MKDVAHHQSSMVVSDLVAQREASSSWEQELSSLLRDVDELFRYLELPSSYLSEARHASKLFPLRVPKPFLKRMTKRNIADPLLRQVLPLGMELESPSDFSSNPIDEISYMPRRGIIHKYDGRVLLLLSPSCAINCRFCFRREFPYAENNLSSAEWSGVIGSIAADPSIKEVILSGGDPLVWPDQKLARLVDELSQVPHLRRLRVHTRLPVVIPQRVTGAMIDWLTKSRLKTVVVLHINHPQEIDTAVSESITKLVLAGVTVLNQATLLKGVNDEPLVQVNLSETLFEVGVLPYYLHLLDRVRGAAHFLVPDGTAIHLYDEMRAMLPGFLVPRLVRDVSGKRSKTLVT